MDYEETLNALQGLLGTVVFVGIAPFEPGGPEMPLVAGLLGTLKRAESGVFGIAPAGDEHVAFEVGDLGPDSGGFITIVKSLFDTAMWVDAPRGRELAIVQGPAHMTFGPPPSN
jgi:hypothetical protein